MTAASPPSQQGKGKRPRRETVPCPNGCGGQVVAGVYIDPTMPCPPRPPRRG